jgi:hypothetical protein
LATALTVLGRQANIDILFADDLIGDRRTPGVRGRVAAGEALARLLSGSGLVARRTGDGAYVVSLAPPVQAAAVPSENEAIPEILVVGSRAQNSDIRRSEDDIQPYQVYNRRAVERAGSNSIDQFARTHLAANAQVASPAQLGSDTRSEINLRGLGANQTLVLVDGRRLPSPPGGAFSFNQPDLNALPVEMIDRIEVLTATAGGIYGTGATAGAVNVVLRRDYRSAEVSATSGISSRGDAFTYRLFGRVGFTPDQGRTDVMLAVGWSQEAMLSCRTAIMSNGPPSAASPAPPMRCSACCRSATGINVVGSGAAGARPGAGRWRARRQLHHLPLGLDGDPARTAMLLKANAGTLQLDRAREKRPSQCHHAARHALGLPQRAARLWRRRRGDAGPDRHAQQWAGSARWPRSAKALRCSRLAGQPFQQTIAISFPDPYSASTIDLTVNTARRVTAGLIVPLPWRWRAYARPVKGMRACRGQ